MQLGKIHKRYRVKVHVLRMDNRYASYLIKIIKMQFNHIRFMYFRNGAPSRRHQKALRGLESLEDYQSGVGSFLCVSCSCQCK